MFKIKYGYKLELKKNWNDKVMWQHKKINKQNKEWRKCTKSWSGISSFNPI